MRQMFPGSLIFIPIPLFYPYSPSLSLSPILTPLTLLSFLSLFIFCQNLINGTSLVSHWISLELSSKIVVDILLKTSNRIPFGVMKSTEHIQ